MKYDITDYSVTGGRKMNQDRVSYAERDNAILIVLADGLGGHEGGELASELLVQRVINTFLNIRQPQIKQPSAFLALTILQAHEAINAMGKAHKPPISPRTTCVLCLVQDGYAYWAHVGDSRLYLVRDGRVHTRTLDHTVIENLRKEGVLSETDMLSHPDKSKLLKCVGGPKQPSIRLGPETKLLQGDTLLLCTDGLWEALDIDHIINFITRDDMEDAVTDMLVAAETKMGARSDNITAACMRWQDKFTIMRPLQPGFSGDVDHETLRAQIKAQRRTTTAATDKTAKSANAAAQGKTAAPATKAAKRKGTPSSLDTEIEELESFLDQILPKR